MGYVELTLRFIIGGVFALAVLGKVSTRQAFIKFVDSLRDINFLGGRKVVWAAAFIVLVECAIVIMAMIPQTALASFAVSAVFLCGAIVLITHALARRRVLLCRCFGAAGEALSGRHLARNLLLLTLACAGMALARGPHVVGSPVIAACSAVVGGCIAFLIVRYKALLGGAASTLRSHRSIDR